MAEGRVERIRWVPAVIKEWNKKGGRLFIHDKRLAAAIPAKAVVMVLLKLRDGTVVEVHGAAEHVSAKKGTVRVRLPVHAVDAVGTGPVLAAVESYDVPPFRG